MKTEQHENQKRIALRELSQHHHGTGTPDERENCAACCLNGYHPKGERRDFINYAGWARLYVQAGKRIAPNLRFAFLAELADENRAYADALKRDILDYGINCGFGSFKNAVRNACGLYD